LPKALQAIYIAYGLPGPFQHSTAPKLATGPKNLILQTVIRGLTRLAMDHLPIPESCKARVKDVPYLGLAPKYDRKGFDGFPERCGIDIESILHLAKFRPEMSHRTKLRPLLTRSTSRAFCRNGYGLEYFTNSKKNVDLN
jgi:hypothetical protein